MFNTIKRVLLYVLTTLFMIFCIWAFPYIAKNPSTFARSVQNKEKTMEKYKNLWNNTRIVEVDDKAPKYKIGDVIGTITIPKINIYEMPIYYGQDSVNKNLQITTSENKGDWGIFGEKSITAVYGYNYQMFGNIEALEKGDKFIVELSYNTFIYEVTKSDIYNANKDNFIDIAFNGKKPYSVNLITHYPADNITTDDMYIVYAKMLKGTKFLK